MSRGLFSVRAIALFEIGKGSLAVVAATGLVRQRQLRVALERLESHLHLDPGRLHPAVLDHALQAGASIDVRILAVGVFLYAGFRFAEGVGLWWGRRWAFWMGSISAALYVPFECVGLYRRPTLVNAGILLVTIAVVVVLARWFPHREDAGHPARDDLFRP